MPASTPRRSRSPPPRRSAISRRGRPARSIACNRDSCEDAPLAEQTKTNPSTLFALLAGALLAAGAAQAQSGAADGQKIAFDRGKGNCLTCHVIKGGDLPGSIAPPLVDIKRKYPDR